VNQEIFIYKLAVYLIALVNATGALMAVKIAKARLLKLMLLNYAILTMD
jgi:hypothetical protein